MGRDNQPGAYCLQHRPLCKDDNKPIGLFEIGPTRQADQQPQGYEALKDGKAAGALLRGGDVRHVGIHGQVEANPAPCKILVEKMYILNCVTIVDFCFKIYIWLLKILAWATSVLFGFKKISK